MIARIGSVLLAAFALACSGPTLLPELAEAERLEREGRDEAALAAYERAARACQGITDADRRRQSCAEARLYRAELLERLDRPRAAAQAYLEIPSEVSDTEAAARGTYHAARLLLELGDEERAYDLIWQTITRYPDELAATDAVALVTEDGRARAPRELYRVLRDLWSALQGTNVAPDLIFAMAELAEHELGDRPAAMALFDELAARHPDSGLQAEALWRAGGLARELGEPRGAIARYRRLLETEEHLPFGFGSSRSEHLDDALLEIARILRDALGECDRAVAELRRLPEAFPHSRLHDDAMFERALTWAAAGDPARACAALAALAERWPDSRYELERAPALRGELRCEAAS